MKTEDRQEIELLKRTVRAYSQMMIAYRLGQPQLPEWVFEALENAKSFYKKEDLRKI